MKRFLIAAALVLTACGPAQDTKPTESSRDIVYTELSQFGSVRRYMDREAGVVCWFYSDYEKGGASCLPINKTLLDPEEH